MAETSVKQENLHLGFFLVLWLVAKLDHRELRSSEVGLAWLKHLELEFGVYIFAPKGLFV